MAEADSFADHTQDVGQYADPSHGAMLYLEPVASAASTTQPHHDMRGWRTSGLITDQPPVEVMHLAWRTATRIPHAVPTLGDGGPLSTSHRRMAHLPVGGVEASLSRRLRYLERKRIGDAVLVILGSPLWVPVLLVAWLAVRVLDGGPAVFTQERVGLNGRPFTMYKLRTMRIDAERDGAAFAAEVDPRVTCIGAFLRRTRLDELPQLINVLKGEMSLIGPRPEQSVFVRKFERSIPGYELRHRVRPGITGLAQVNQGYVADEDGTVTKVRHDLEYISRVSLHLDARIVLRTVFVLITGWGAR